LFIYSHTNTLNGEICVLCRKGNKRRKEGRKEGRKEDKMKGRKEGRKEETLEW